MRGIQRDRESLRELARVRASLREFEIERVEEERQRYREGERDGVSLFRLVFPKTSAKLPVVGSEGFHCSS